MTKNNEIRRPYSPQLLLERIQTAQITFSGQIVTKGMCGAVTGALSRACGVDAGRYEVLFYLFGEGQGWKSIEDVSSKELYDEEWHALYKWVNPSKNDLMPKGQQWTASEFLDQECAMILGLNIIEPQISKLADKMRVGGKRKAEDSIRELGW